MATLLFIFSSTSVNSFQHPYSTSFSIHLHIKRKETSAEREKYKVSLVLFSCYFHPHITECKLKGANNHDLEK